MNQELAYKVIYMYPKRNPPPMRVEEDVNESVMCAVEEVTIALETDANLLKTKCSAISL